jgi:hypothetical protein
LIPRLPTEEEINVFDSLDERDAVKHFFGKDLEQAESLFRENFLRYQEDLMWMGPNAFHFYLPAAVSYLLGAESDHDLDAAHSFCGLIEHLLKWEHDRIAASASIIRAAVVGILEKLGRFGCDLGSNGRLPSRYQRLLSRLDA